jgi:hypothetical protein
VKISQVLKTQTAHQIILRCQLENGSQKDYTLTQDAHSVNEETLTFYPKRHHVFWYTYDQPCFIEQKNSSENIIDLFTKKSIKLTYYEAKIDLDQQVQIHSSTFEIPYRKKYIISDFEREFTFDRIVSVHHLKSNHCAVICIYYCEEIDSYFWDISVYTFAQVPEKEKLIDTSCIICLLYSKQTKLKVSLINGQILILTETTVDDEQIHLTTETSRCAFDSKLGKFILVA